MPTSYELVPPEVKEPVVKLLRKELAPVRLQIAQEIKKRPKDWIGPYHFWWGMKVRNMLRDAGYGEVYFGVENLDEIYAELIEAAVKEEK
jgi:hypothetical protein